MVLIDSSFEGGNIEVVDANSFDDIRLKIRKDTKSDFFQWFAFRLIGAVSYTHLTLPTMIGV